MSNARVFSRLFIRPRRLALQRWCLYANIPDKNVGEGGSTLNAVKEEPHGEREAEVPENRDAKHLVPLPEQPPSAGVGGYYSWITSSLQSALGRVLHQVSRENASGENAKKPEKKRKPDRMEVVEQTRILVNQLLEQAAESATDDSTMSTKLLERIERLNRHLATFPSSRLVAIEYEHKSSQKWSKFGLFANRKNAKRISTKNNHNIIPFLLELKRSKEAEQLKAKTLQCLTLCGHTYPPKGPGIRILSIDGGGTRGLIALECLAALEREAGGKKVHEMFDLIVGVSTGALLASLLVKKGLSIEDARKQYEQVSKKIFKYGYGVNWMGSLDFIGRRPYISRNSKNWEAILREQIGEDSMLHSAGMENVPKLAIVSCVVNTNQLIPYLFRNYEHPAKTNSHYRGSTKYKFWQALLATTAAPTYFTEVELDELIHQDGGILINNPTAIALHEARQLWPHEKFQCIVSIGNGRSLPEIEPELLPKSDWMINTMIQAATETENIHFCLSDLMQQDAYFRLNPYTSRKGGYPLDTTDPILLDQMRRDANLYTRRNRQKIKAVAKQLTQPGHLFRLNSVRRFFQDPVARQLFMDEFYWNRRSAKNK